MMISTTHVLLVKNSPFPFGYRYWLKLPFPFITSHTLFAPAHIFYFMLFDFPSHSYHTPQSRVVFR
jgi:hypothetical protein